MEKPNILDRAIMTSGSRPRGEAGGGEGRTERDQKRVRQLRSQPDEKRA